MRWAGALEANGRPRRQSAAARPVREDTGVCSTLTSTDPGLTCAIGKAGAFQQLQTFDQRQRHSFESCELAKFSIRLFLRGNLKVECVWLLEFQRGHVVHGRRVCPGRLMASSASTGLLLTAS